MDLLAKVVTTLEGQNVPVALIGAAAMAAHGVSRSTQDIDLLSLSHACLEPQVWTDLVRVGATVDVRVGDDDDPLLGVVRIAQGTQMVDVVVGRSRWQRGVLDRAQQVTVFSVSLRVVTPEDLVLLKLYAGGFQDRWDIAQLLQVHGEGLRIRIEDRVAELPQRCQALWQQLRDAKGPG